MSPTIGGRTLELTEDVMKMAAWIGSSLVLFLAAAKAHGRELRFERVAAGVDRVVFGGSNPAFVEELWRAERWRFWIAAPVAAATVALLLHSRGLRPGATAFGALTWGPAIAFAACGVASFVRTGSAHDAPAGSLVWWSIVAASAAVAGVTATHALRPA